MTVSERKTFKLFWILSCITISGCIYAVFAFAPSRNYIVSHLKAFVRANLPILLNILGFTFLVGSTVLICAIWFVLWDEKRTRLRTQRYVSQLVARDYYKKGGKKKNYYQTIQAALSKQPMEADEEFEDEKDQLIYSSRSHEIREKFRKLKAKGLNLEPPEDTSDGTHKIFYPNGILMKEVTYKNGKMEGAFRLYYEDGTIHQQKFFKEGLLNGVFTAYDEFGVPYFDMTYKEGVKEGIENGYYKSGVLEYQEIYQNGKRMSRKSYDESGELIFKYDTGKPFQPLPAQEPDKKEEDKE